MALCVIFAVAATEKSVWWENRKAVIRSRLPDPYLLKASILTAAVEYYIWQLSSGQASLSESA